MATVEISREDARLALEGLEKLREELTGEIILGRRSKRQEERLERYNRLSEVEERLRDKIFEGETRS